ncbi:LysR family transcriptional regulator ArgP [Pelagibius sp. Alg239-R121]|uniref:LysR family transcriptional regulator ArgP n=1 Tax=Pelagibius sp. Alg239-R121 TaxID=2993448 RepID=UPI0024A6968F|nr:LysR family transcriptional regulator ArgP [Pelagibius sp. Alg239-R121]
MLDYPLMAAVAAVIRTGSFEQAAQELRVTPSAVSQRVKLLEDRLGVVLVVRAQPCTATPTGLRLFRHVEEVGLLEHTLSNDLAGLMPVGKSATLRVAVNADSLATWFIDVIAACEGILFELVLDDQDYSADWLRRGEVVAAVSAQPGPVQGCDSKPLGALRYIATASPDYVKRWFPSGVTQTAIQQAPALNFNMKDRLQSQWVQKNLGKRLVVPSHTLPSTQAFIDATLTGIGWGMNPEPLVARHLAEGRLVPLIPDQPLDVELHWQSSRMVATAISDLNKAVRDAAQKWLITR